MSEKRVLRPWQAVNELTMWYDYTLWIPFIEDEDANITGPGHQNKAAFAALVNHYDAHASGEPLSDNWGPEDISHGWVQVYEYEDGEIYFKPTVEDRTILLDAYDDGIMHEVWVSYMHGELSYRSGNRSRDRWDRADKFLDKRGK